MKEQFSNNLRNFRNCIKWRNGCFSRMRASWRASSCRRKLPFPEVAHLAFAGLLFPAFAKLRTRGEFDDNSLRRGLCEALATGLVDAESVIADLCSPFSTLFAGGTAHCTDLFLSHDGLLPQYPRCGAKNSRYLRNKNSNNLQNFRNCMKRRKRCFLHVTFLRCITKPFSSTRGRESRRGLSSNYDLSTLVTTMLYPTQVDEIMSPTKNAEADTL